MRLVAVAALAFALAACGGGGGEELAAGNSQLSPAQVDAALGPADQSTVNDALPSDDAGNALDLLGNDAGASNAKGSAVNEGGE
jgi:hypothetical protein